MAGESLELLTRLEDAAFVAADIVPKLIVPRRADRLGANVPEMEKARGYLGRGGENVRQAVCLYLEALVCYKPKLALTDAAVDRYQTTIDDCLRVAQDFVQQSSLKALTAPLSIEHYCDKSETTVPTDTSV